MDFLTKIGIRGFKSIKEAEVELGPINVLIGANASGKSNLISVFEMMKAYAGGDRSKFEHYIRKSGGADTFLQYGSKVTDSIKLTYRLSFQNIVYVFQYTFEPAEPDDLIFSSTVGEVEGTMKDRKESLFPSADQELRRMISSSQLIHINDTSNSSKMIKQQNKEDGRELFPGAENLAAYLYRMKLHYNHEYNMIVRQIRAIFPYFGDFVLEPLVENPDNIMLNWRENKQYAPLFSLYQLPDGVRRFIPLAAVLMQPKEEMPELLIIDEPELGLHPYALNVLADLLHMASNHCQIIIATQSVTLLENFDISDVIVTERTDEGSTFKRLKEDDFKVWLEEYTVSELWEKNVLGGRP